MQRETDGSITIYLALTMTVLLSMILMLIEGARDTAIRCKIECAADLSMYSVFAEYNKELLDQYDLFFIDASYGSSGGSISRVADRLTYYMSENFTVSDSSSVKDLLGLSLEEVTILDYSLASDESGAVFKRQAVDYIKDYYGASILETLQDLQTQVSSTELTTKDVTSEREANQSAIDNYEIPATEVSEDEWEEVEIDNPADAVNASRVGVLGLVLTSSMELSEAGINKSNYISSRSSVAEGTGLSNRDDSISTSEELLFNLYLMQKMGCYTNPKENSVLQYQQEYIIAGKDSDYENLTDIVNRLLLMRETANVIYLMKDAVKQAEAEALATATCALVMQPELIELVKYSLILAWGYAEAVYDVRTLLQGGRVPLYKTSETWHYSIEGMLNYAADTTTGDTSSSLVDSLTGSSDASSSSSSGSSSLLDLKDGLSYQNYLLIFMMLQNTTNKTMRAMDIIEMDVRNTDGNSNFRLDFCLDYLKAEMFTSSTYGYNHKITRSYVYM